MSVRNEQRLAAPGRIGTICRGVAAWIVFGAAALAFKGGGLWLIAAGGLAAFGLLLVVAALVRQPGCEVNLIWQRLLGRAPIDCFLFGPIDRWEQNKCK